MPATLQAVSATSHIQEEYPESYRASGDERVITEAQSFKEVLGFDIDKTKQRVPKILAAFQEHGFHLYRPSDVDTYKDRQARRVKFRAEHRNHVWLACAIVSTATTAAMWVALCGVAAYDIAGGSVTKPYWVLAVLATIMTTIFAYFCVIQEEEAVYVTGEVTTSWRDYSLEDFPDQIPLVVLKQMRDIRLAIPNAVFIVSKLELHVEEVRRPQRSALGWLDPILYVRMKGDKFALPIAVWNEPKFDGTPIMASSTSLD